jgi:cytochrome c553
MMQFRAVKLLDLPIEWPVGGIVIAIISVALAFLVAPFQAASAQSDSIPSIATACAPCHGLGQKSIYLREQLLAFRTGKRKHPEMKLIGRDLSDREIDQLVIYYSTLVPR